ncbi:hypothetical protein LNQ03_05860 [Klebsiella pneumoniae subsp. pneumoniae]|nr:hypothetical protein [Klebsiella pneumoniae subsp. pneumoniae]
MFSRAENASKTALLVFLPGLCAQRR